MTPETAKALEDSIAHWKRMHRQPFGREIPSSDYCALCIMFYYDDCMGCPVNRRTGQTKCEGSPYWNAQTAWLTGDHRKWSKAAEAEIDFLESLIEEKV